MLLRPDRTGQHPHRDQHACGVLCDPAHTSLPVTDPGVAALVDRDFPRFAGYDRVFGHFAGWDVQSEDPRIGACLVVAEPDVLRVRTRLRGNTGVLRPRHLWVAPRG